MPGRFGNRRYSRFGNLRYLFWLLCPTLFVLTARGQDALFSSLSLDQTIAARSAPAAQPADRPHLGPVKFGMGGYAGVS